MEDFADLIGRLRMQTNTHTMSKCKQTQQYIFHLRERKSWYLVRASAGNSGRRFRRRDFRPGKQIGGGCVRLSYWCVSLHFSEFSHSLSLCVWDIFKKIWNFQIDKKNLGWCKNVIHQTYYYFFYFLRDWDIWGVQTSDSLSLTYLYVDMCYLLLKKII